MCVQQVFELFYYYSSCEPRLKYNAVPGAPLSKFTTLEQLYILS